MEPRLQRLSSMKKIEIRKVLAGDAEYLFPLIYKSSVTDTILWDGPETIEEYKEALRVRAEQSERGELHMFSLLYEGKPVGSGSVRPFADPYRGDVGLWIGRPFHGKGIGKTAVKEFIKYGFQSLKMEKIEATVMVGNVASRKIFEANGFKLEGTIRKAIKKRGKLVDEWLLGITREDYLS